MKDLCNSKAAWLGNSQLKLETGFLETGNCYPAAKSFVSNDGL